MSPPYPKVEYVSAAAPYALRGQVLPPSAETWSPTLYAAGHRAIFGEPTLTSATRIRTMDNGPMSLVALRDARIAFGERPLLDGAQLTLLAGERLGLIGRNGTGKSTLLAVLAGRIHLDEGEVQRRDGLRVALVEQEPDLQTADSLRDSLLR